METPRKTELQRAEAFGREFVALMGRLNARYASLLEGEDSPERLAARRDVAAAFSREAEELLVAHGMAEPVAEYVRHVIRRGFDAEYDELDPTDAR